MMTIKILEIEEFSAGIGGVSTRVFQESQQFVKLGWDVTIFSSDIIEGINDKAKSEEIISGVKIKRFPAKKSPFSKNVNYFSFEKSFIELKPDVVIVHTIHPHAFKALNLCLKNNIPCYLVTHAPFNIKRKFPLNILTYIYYLIKVKPVINKFTKIITITKWEEKYLEKLGVSKDKLVYIPNGMPYQFFSQKKEKAGKSVLFLGRIAPVKDLETLIFAAKLVPEIKFDIVGMAEENCLSRLKKLIEQENIKNVKFLPAVFDIKEKIKLIDHHSIFVLPSKREAMPQSLIEAMARGKLILSSSTDGGKELVDNGKTGFIFNIGNFAELASLIKQNISGNPVIQKNAEEFARQFSWDLLIKKYEKLIHND